MLTSIWMYPINLQEAKSDSESLSYWYVSLHVGDKALTSLSIMLFAWLTFCVSILKLCYEADPQPGESVDCFLSGPFLLKVPRGIKL